jgi:3-hydroxyisobutyrate dehydrogenase-like beta-hydroxyacid dehydrogenase
VLLNLPTTDAVEEAVFGPEGVATVVASPQLVVDFSTVKVDKGRSFASKLREATGCGWVDAPVSGGPPASGNGTLTVMAGGDAEDIARVTPLMAHLAARFTHMGPAGAGLVAKMINQLIVGCTHAVLAEALVIGGIRGHRRRAHSRMLSPVDTPTARCCSGCIRAWRRATSRRRATPANC